MSTPSEKTLPDITIFPDLNVVMRTPAGREYRGRALEHDSQSVADEKWYQLQNLTAVRKEDQHATAILRQQFSKNGRPDYFPAQSNAEPLRLNLNRIPPGRRTQKNADTLIGEVWDADGLWTVLVKPSQSERVLFSGSILPAKVEIENNPASKIAQYRRPIAPGELPLDAAEISQGQKPALQG